MYCICVTGLSRRELLSRYVSYANAAEDSLGKRERRLIAKPILNLFHAESNGKTFRQQLDKLMLKEDMRVGEMLLTAMQVIPESVLDRVDSINSSTRSVSEQGSDQPAGGSVSISIT